jgi:acyl-CoA reductase-like NAD-dependent aldehyde dehydrogenase
VFVYEKLYFIYDYMCVFVPTKMKLVFRLNDFQETTLYGATVKIHEPVGVIGIACPDQYPLLAFVSLFAPAVIRGNTVVIVPSEKYPLLALDLYQVC